MTEHKDCRHDGTERSRITYYTDGTTSERRLSVLCCACGHESDGLADAEPYRDDAEPYRDDRRDVSRVFLGIAAAACALGLLAIYHDDRSAAFAFAVVGAGLVIISTAIRLRWIA